MAENELHVTEECRHGTWTMVVSGDLDPHSAPALCSHLTAHRGARLVVDLSGLAFCDSTGLRALQCEARETYIAGGSMELVAPPKTALRRLLEVTGLLEVLGVHVDLGRALAAA